VVSQYPDRLNLYFHTIADRHRPNTTGCAGGNNVAGQQRHHPGNKADNVRDRVDEVVGITLLLQLTVKVRFYRCITGVKLRLNTGTE